MEEMEAEKGPCQEAGLESRGAQGAIVSCSDTSVREQGA